MNENQMTKAKRNVELLLACHNKDFVKAKELIDSGADVNVKVPIMKEKGIVTNDYKTPLISSIKESNEKIVELLLVSGANTELRDHNNRTALMHACGKNLFPIAELLVHYKANVNATNELGREIYDWTALTWSIYTHVPKMVYLLLQKEVIVDKRAYEFAKSEKCICTDRNYTNAKIILEYLQKYIITHPIK